VIVLLAACSGGQRSLSSIGASFLADHTAVESSHHGMGSTSFRVLVDDGGGVWIERGASSRTPCGALGSARLEALRGAVRRALAAGLRAVYNTSAHSGPNANYSRSQTLELAVDGRRRRLQIEGWADVPAEVAQILGQLSEAANKCPSGG